MSLTTIIRRAQAQARARRAARFRACFRIDSDTRILDLGSEHGANIHRVLEGTAVDPANVYIADIDSDAVRRGSEQFGFTPVVISEAEPLPFEDGFFDIIYCSSVIEHVTLPKDRVWSPAVSGKAFRDESLRRQQLFANDIARLGRGYFVQTPNRWFPIESHSWLPFVGWLPRAILIPTLRLSNTIWIKKTLPDWHLLTSSQMRRLFPGAAIETETSFGLPKSIMAIKN